MNDRDLPKADHGEGEAVELTDAEREALRGLPREMIPPARLEERVVDALKADGWLGGHGGSGRTHPSRLLGRRRWGGWAGAVAASLALFASGVALGQWNATRTVAAAMSQRGASDPAAQAAQVQEAGSDYVRAVAHLADLAAAGDQQGVAPGLEAARVALHAAALELARLSPDDPTLRLVLAVLEDRLRASGSDTTKMARTTIWF